MTKNWNSKSFWIWMQKGRMIWTLRILQSKFLGLSREEHVIILPILMPYQLHHPSDQHGESSHDCDDRSPKTHDLVNDRHKTVLIYTCPKHVLHKTKKVLRYLYHRREDLPSSNPIVVFQQHSLPQPQRNHQPVELVSHAKGPNT